MHNVNKIMSKVSKYDYISFDVFDTLVIRLVNRPKQIFSIVEMEYNETHDRPISNYKSVRIDCEKRIVDHIPSIDDIYDNMQEVYSKEDCEWLKSKEIETEIKYCVVNEEIKEVYDYCKKNGKTVFAISDMYLSSDIIEKILLSAGYEVDEIIVSNEKNCNKFSSKLFNYMNVEDKKKVLHIGDSWKADYFGAKKYGIDSVKISKKHFKEIDDNYQAIMRLKKNSDYYYRLGFELLGPILYSFAVWLKNEFDKNHIQNIYFLAREGKIYQKVFDVIYKDDYKTHYLYMSRRAITMSNFDYMDFSNLHDVLKYFTIKGDSTLLDTLKYLNIDSIDTKWDLNANVYSYVEDKEFFHYIVKKLKTESKRVNSVCLEYLKQENVHGKFAIVDIGWNGTMQKCLTTFLCNNHVDFSLFGYYFMLFKDLENGYSFITRESSIASSIRDNPVLLENLFQCVDGSTIGYEKNNKMIVPVKKKIEFDQYSQDAIHNIDLGIVDFVQSWIQFGYCLDYQKFEQKNLDRFRDFIDNPSMKDIRKFQEFCYSDIKDNERIVYSGFNIKKGLFSSGWKYGYLKSILRIPFNYKRIVKILKKISGE